jgi:membrane protein involved in colicin uptake
MEKLFRQIGDEIREYTAEEYEQNQKDIVELENLAVLEAQAKAEAAAAKAAAEAKLAALGLTADDLKALGLGGN